MHLVIIVILLIILFYLYVRRDSENFTTFNYIMDIDKAQELELINHTTKNMEAKSLLAPKNTYIIKLNHGDIYGIRLGGVYQFIGHALPGIMDHHASRTLLLRINN